MASLTLVTLGQISRLKVKVVCFLSPQIYNYIIQRYNGTSSVWNASDPRPYHDVYTSIYTIYVKHHPSNLCNKPTSLLLKEKPFENNPSLWLNQFHNEKKYSRALPHSTQALPGRAHTSFAQLKTWRTDTGQDVESKIWEVSFDFGGKERWMSRYLAGPLNKTTRVPKVQIAVAPNSFTTAVAGCEIRTMWKICRHWSGTTKAPPQVLKMSP